MEKDRKGLENEKTTINLSISKEDKKKLKKYAAESETTISAVIHSWIIEKCKEVN